MTQLGKAEDEIFKTRQQKEMHFKARDKMKRQRTEEADRRRRPDWTLLKDTQYAPTVSCFKILDLWKYIINS